MLSTISVFFARHPLGGGRDGCRLPDRYAKSVVGVARGIRRPNKIAHDQRSNNKAKASDTISTRAMRPLFLRWPGALPKAMDSLHQKLALHISQDTERLLGEPLVSIFCFCKDRASTIKRCID